MYLPINGRNLLSEEDYWSVELQLSMGTRDFPLFASHYPKNVFLKSAMVIFGGGHDHSLVSLL